MKLIRFGNVEREKPGVFLQGKRKDLSQHFGDWDRSFFRDGGLKKLEDVLRNNKTYLMLWKMCVGVLLWPAWGRALLIELQ